MKISVFALIFAVLFGLLSLAIPASCQSQAGAVAIAAAIRPAQSPVYTELEGEQPGSVVISVNSELDEFAECVAKNRSNGASYKEAAKDCKDFRKIQANESTRIANEAADATKASRPIILDRGGRSGSWSNSYPRTSRTVVVRQEARTRPAAQARPRAQARPEAQPRPAAPPRPASSPRSSSRR